MGRAEDPPVRFRRGLTDPPSHSKLTQVMVEMLVYHHPQLAPEIRPKTRLGGQSAPAPRAPNRSTNSRNRPTSVAQAVGRVARNSGGLLPSPLGQGIT